MPIHRNFNLEICNISLNNKQKRHKDMRQLNINLRFSQYYNLFP